MKSSKYGRISDKLLSAYIDNAITEQERNLVEAAVAADAEVAWRLDTLLQTVQLLHALPELALPRSFTIQESFLIHEDPRTAHAAGQGAGSSWFGRVAQSWRDFWQSGAPIYRNLAAVSLVLLLVLVGGDTLFSSGFSARQRIPAPAAEPAQEIAAEAPQAASAAAEPGDAEEIVAEDALEMETTLADSAGEESPSDVTQPEDTTAKEVAEPPAAQDMAAAMQDDAQPASQPEVAAAAMAEAPAAETAPLSAESAPAESVVTAPTPGEALRLALPPDEAPPGPPPATLSRTERDGLGGGGAQPQALWFGESDETDFAAAEAFTAAAPQAEAAEAISAEAAPLTSTAAVEAAAVSPLDAPAIARAPVPAAEADNNDAATQPPDAAALSALDGGTEEQHTSTPLASADSSEPANAEGTPADAALPAVQPRPPSASETQPSATAETSPILPLQPISLGLLFATLIFGGLWWRSRGAA